MSVLVRLFGRSMLNFHSFVKESNVKIIGREPFAFALNSGVRDLVNHAPVR